MDHGRPPHLLPISSTFSSPFPAATCPTSLESILYFCVFASLRELFFLLDSREAAKPQHKKDMPMKNNLEGIFFKISTFLSGFCAVKA